METPPVLVSSKRGTFTRKERDIMRQEFGTPDKLTVAMIEAKSSSTEFEAIWDRMVTANDIKLGGGQLTKAMALYTNSMRKFLINK